MKKWRKTYKNKKTVATIFSRDVLDGMAICELCTHKSNNQMFTNQHACAQEWSRSIPITKMNFIIFRGCIGRFGRQRLKLKKKTWKHIKNKRKTIAWPFLLFEGRIGRNGHLQKKQFKKWIYNIYKMFTDQHACAQKWRRQILATKVAPQFFEGPLTRNCRLRMTPPPPARKKNVHRVRELRTP